MKVEYITKFYKKLEELGLELTGDTLNGVLLLDEDTVEVLLKSDLSTRFDCISTLLKNAKLAELGYFSRIINIIASCPSECYESAFVVANNNDVIESGYCAVLTEKVANAKTKANSEIARNTAVNIKKLGKLGLWEVAQIIETIANSSSDKNALHASVVALDDNAIQSGSLTQLVSIIANIKNEKNGLSASKVARDFTVIKSGKVIELTKIVANAKGENAEDAENVAIDEDVINTEHVVQLTKIVANAKKASSEYAGSVATDVDVLESGHVVELTKIVANSKGENAQWSQCVAIDYGVIVSGKVIELTKEVANAKNVISAKYASEAACDSDIIALDNAVQIIKTIASAKTESNAMYAKEVAMYCVSSRFDIGQENIAELVRIVAETKVCNASHIREIAIDDDVLASGKVVELAKIISNAKSNKNASFASTVAVSVNVIESGLVVEFTKLVVETKNTYNVESIYCLIIDELNEQNRNEVYELAKIFSSANEAKVEFLQDLLNYNIDIKDILLIAKAIENIRLNKNNVAMVVSLIITGDYNKSEKPIESIVSILKSTSDYIVFKDAYEIDPANAIKGLTALDKEFKGIDITDTQKCYVKLPKKKKEDNK